MSINSAAFTKGIANIWSTDINMLDANLADSGKQSEQQAIR